MPEPASRILARRGTKVSASLASPSTSAPEATSSANRLPYPRFFSPPRSQRDGEGSAIRRVELGAPAPPALAVLDAEQAEADAGEAHPQQPGAARLLQRPVERQQPEEAEQEKGGADLDRPHPVHVQRLHGRDQVGPL